MQQISNQQTFLLQASKTYKEQIRGDVYSIANKLQRIIHGDIERQTYHIQKLLADKLDRFKEKESTQVEEHIQ